MLEGPPRGMGIGASRIVSRTESLVISLVESRDVLSLLLFFFGPLPLR